MQKNKFLISLIVAAVLLGVIIVSLFLLPLSWREQYVTFRTILAVFTGIIVAVIIRGEFEFKYKLGIKATGGTAAFLIVYLVNPAMPVNDSFYITVFVHGPDGRGDNVLRNSGKVVLDINGDRREGTIDESGAVTFKEIPISFLKRTVPIIINGGIYQAEKSDSQYVLMENGVYYIKVVPKGLAVVRGRVVDKDMESVAGAMICVQSSVGFSDSYGNFRLEIPADEQLRLQTVMVKKEGYKVWTGQAAPETKQEVQVRLHPK